MFSSLSLPSTVEKRDLSLNLYVSVVKSSLLNMRGKKPVEECSDIVSSYYVVEKRKLLCLVKPRDLLTLRNLCMLS